MSAKRWRRVGRLVIEDAWLVLPAMLLFALLASGPAHLIGPHLHKRTVTVTDWETVE